CLLFISLLLLYLTSLLFPYTTLFRSLKFIEDAINKYIISQFGDMYVFVFVGGDTQTEAEIIDMLEKKAKIGYTINDIREEFGKPPVEGGDVVLAGVHVQRLGQLIQKEQLEEERKRGIQEFVAQQTGYNGDMDRSEEHTSEL